jgi:L-threonylcarbamoyladenylate synthase
MRTPAMPRIAPPTLETIAHAAGVLHAGGAVAFPTETVYGLGALTLNQAGLEQVYQLKGRPASNPLIAHVLDASQARLLIAPGAWDARCHALAERFWPGPLTLVLPKASRVPDRATAGLPTIAVRSPAHQVARALIEKAGPISAPSANRSGRVSPTTAQHVFDEFNDPADAIARDLLIIDGGQCELGIESTVLDLSAGGQPRLLRPGSVTLEQLRDVLGEIDAPAITSQAASPGTASSHYAPQTPVELVDTAALRSTLAAHAAAGRRCVALCFDVAAVAPPHAAIGMAQDAGQYARDLYRALREADARGHDSIIIELPASSSQQWRAINDRVRRAAAR